MAAFLTAFRNACPARLTPYPGVREVVLDELRRRVPVALISDGEMIGQRRKLAALGLADKFDRPNHPATWLCVGTFADAVISVLPSLVSARPAR